MKKFNVSIPVPTPSDVTRPFKAAKSVSALKVSTIKAHRQAKKDFEADATVSNQKYTPQNVHEWELLRLQELLLTIPVSDQSPETVDLALQYLTSVNTVREQAALSCDRKNIKRVTKMLNEYDKQNMARLTPEEVEAVEALSVLLG